MRWGANKRKRTHWIRGPIGRASKQRRRDKRKRTPRRTRRLQPRRRRPRRQQRPKRGRGLQTSAIAELRHRWRYIRNRRKPSAASQTLTVSLSAPCAEGRASKRAPCRTTCGPRPAMARGTRQMMCSCGGILIGRGGLRRRSGTGNGKPPRLWSCLHGQ